MEIVNIEAGTFKEMVTSIQMLKEKLENQSGSVHDTEHIAENTTGHEKQRYLTLLPDRPKDLLSETGCYQTD